jgi:hypothetical protein
MKRPQWIILLIALAASCNDEPRREQSHPTAAVPPPGPAPVPAPLARVAIPSTPLPAAWTAGKGYPPDLSVVISASSWGTTSTTVVEADGEGAATVVNERKDGAERWECRYTIGHAELAKFDWSAFMGFLEQRRREGVPIGSPYLPADAPSHSVALRAFGVASPLVLREYDAIHEVQSRVAAVTKGAAHWRSRSMRGLLENLSGELDRCYGGDRPERHDYEAMRAYNARRSAPPLEAKIQIDGASGRARALSIGGEEELKEERRCMADAIERVRLPIPGFATCNPMWTLLVRPASSAILPNPYRLR